MIHMFYDRSRRRIAAKLERIKFYVHNQEHTVPGKWDAVVTLTDLIIKARYQPQWQWEGFASELEWVKAQR